MKCKTCGQKIITATEMDEYEKRKAARLEEMDKLFPQIECITTYSSKYYRFLKLLNEQSLDDMRMGL